MTSSKLRSYSIENLKLKKENQKLIKDKEDSEIYLKKIHAVYGNQILILHPKVDEAIDNLVEAFILKTKSEMSQEAWVYIEKHDPVKLKASTKAVLIDGIQTGLKQTNSPKQLHQNEMDSEIEKNE